MNTWLDITLPLHNDLPPWPGEKAFCRTPDARIGVNGSDCNTSLLSMSSHTGTHVDAPRHFIADGETVDNLDPDVLIGPALVLDLMCVTGVITDADLLERVPEGTVRLLLKTRNSRLIGDGHFHTDFVALGEDAALYLVKTGIRLVGLDYYSIAPFDDPVRPHKAFLGASGAVALENIDLRQAEEGWYDLVCLPLPVVGCDGAPARALIRRREE